MPRGPGARILDQTLHQLPGKLLPGPGSANVFIGGLPAWRGIGAAAVAGLQSAKAASQVRVTASAATRAAAMGTPGAPAAIAADEALKAAEAMAMASMITSASGGCDIHICVAVSPVPLPPPPHGPGVVIDGSTGVFINGFPACRQGDTILESFGPPNKILVGFPTVIIGETMGGSGGSGSGSAPIGQVGVLKDAAAKGAPFCEVCNS